MKKLPFYLACLMAALFAGAACSNDLHASGSEAVASVASDEPVVLQQSHAIEPPARFAESSSPSEAPEPLAPPAEPQASQSVPSEEGLRIRLVDAAGNPVTGLHVVVGLWSHDNLAGYTDENGDAFWRGARAGEESVKVSGYPRVSARQVYPICVTEDFAPIELVWEHGNPSLLPFPPGPTVTLRFLDRFNQPAVGVSGAYGFVATGDEPVPEPAMCFGPSDKEGVHVFRNLPTSIYKTYSMDVWDRNDEHYAFELTVTDEYTQVFTIVLNDPIPEEG